jgi:hypothetical protein
MSVSSITESIEYLKCLETDDSHGIHPGLKLVIDDILELIKNGYINQDQCSEFTEAIIDCILFTRDIKSGRGLRKLAFSYLFTFQQYFAMKAIFILYMFVNSETEHQIGSWRDIREYCEFVAKHSPCGQSDTIIKPIIGMYNNQLIKDIKLLDKSLDAWDDKCEKMNRDFERLSGNVAISPPQERPLIEKLSFAAKWAPRDKLKHRWLFTTLVQMWAYITPECKDIITAAVTDDEKKTAMAICKRKYKAMVTKLSIELDR